jgi:acyl carrier protein
MKEKLINALAEALEMEPTQIKTTDMFRDYENYSSLTELSVFAMLDSEFGVDIEMEEYNKYRTVDNLINLVSGNNAR